MESVGQKLREARLRLGLTLEHVSAETRITLNYLSAIERDDLSCISSPFFYKGFVRQYADKLKLDYSCIAGAVEQASSSLPEPLIPGQEHWRSLQVRGLRRPKQRGFDRLPSILPQAIAFCLVVAACSGLYAMWENSPPNWQTALTGVTTLLHAVPQRAIALAGKLPNVMSVADPARATVRKAIRLASASLAPSANSSLSAHPGQVASANLSSSAFHVKLSALESTWLSIVADGKQTFSGVLDTSQTKLFEGHNSARIRTINAGGITLVFNGKQIGTLGPRGQVRTVVFTKDNYKVLSPREQSPLALTALIQTFE